MFVKKRFIVIAGLAIAVTVASAAATSAGPSREFTNLKVLPKDVSSKDLQHIMIDVFEDGLGVNCGFCHAEQKGSHKLDYASDAKPEKQIARNMMRMTLKFGCQTRTRNESERRREPLGVHRRPILMSSDGFE